jgi:hypothetical protein
MSVNRTSLMGSPARISRTVSVERQTPKTDFATRVKVGLQTAAAAVAAGAAVAAPFVPGAAILSAAVSSISNQGGVNAGGLGSAGSAASAIDGGLAGMQNDNLRMMKIQIAMQRENTVFSTLSNILKVRHDTQKNSIGNIR